VSNDKKMIVFGNKGMLGRVLAARVNALGFDLPECDITQREAVLELVQRHRPEVIINCAAYTRVDDAEQHEALATKVNGDAVGYLAEAAKAVDAYFLTISTDYVFPGEGEQPYLEDDPVGPQSAYGRSKLAGEERVQEIDGRWAIARTQWLYGRGGPNFIDTITRLARERDHLKVVDDQVGAPTWAEDLCGMLLALAEKQAEGIYHTANSEYASWFEVARFAVEKLGLNCTVEPCSSKEFPRPAKRPHNSRLNLERIAAVLGHSPRSWREALAEYLAEKSR